ncbi:MAG: pyridoxamine 5'-phosphate oxidase family protein [Gallionella sp.]|nr:pyridoxamine 5'-phosphate oxidase family protein [Gallionella sp.]
MNNAAEARRLLRAHRYGALSTLSKKLDGAPFGSITPYLPDHDGSLLLLVSGLAEHTKNILHDPRVSLITHNQQDPNIQMQGRVTLIGNAHLLEDREAYSTRYLHHFPEAEINLSLPDFRFCRIQPVAIRYIGGVGRIHWIRMADYAVPQAAAFAAHEEALLRHINAQQQDALHYLLKQNHNVSVADAQAIALDCDGLVVRSGEQSWRLNFAEVLADPAKGKQLSALHYHLP